MLPATPMLNLIDKFILKQTPKQCLPGEHWHPGIVECHPQPPLPGSWHKDPKIRHTKEGAISQKEERKEQEVPSTDKLYRLARFVASFVSENDLYYLRQIREDIETYGQENIDLTSEDKALLERVNSQAYDALEEIHSTLSQPIDDIEPYDTSQGGSLQREYFASILDQTNSQEDNAQTKQRIAKELADKLRNNKDFEALAKWIANAAGGGTGFTFPTHDYIVDAVSELIHTWAVSSADHNQLAIQLQWAVAEEFGLEDFYESSITGKTGSLDFKNEKGFKAFVRAVYDHTQEWFQKHNIDSVILYRGMAIEENIFGGKFRQGNDSIVLQPMSSFSTDINVARSFGEVGISEDTSIILSARVPVNKIIATAQTGWGCKEEGEMVILGGTYKMHYRVSSFGA